MILSCTQNFPLYLRTVNPQNEADLQFQYLVHSSIDVVEEEGEWGIVRRRTERLSLCVCVCVCVCEVSTIGTPKAGQHHRDHYLGLLYPSEQYKVLASRP